MACAPFSPPLDEYGPEEWRHVINIDLNGSFYVNHAIVPFMKQQNYVRLVNVASIAA